MDSPRARNRTLLLALVLLIIFVTGGYHRHLTSDPRQTGFRVVFPKPEWTSDHPEYNQRHHAENQWKIRRIAACAEAGNCPPHRDEASWVHGGLIFHLTGTHRDHQQIIIMASWHCHAAYYAGYRGGEGVWRVLIMGLRTRQAADGRTHLLDISGVWPSSIG